MADEIAIKPGQVWEDKDTRGGVRQVRVIAVHDEMYGRSVSPVAEVMGERRSTVRIDRLRKRFTLIKDVPDA